MMLYRYQDIQIMHLHLPFLANIAKNANYARVGILSGIGPIGRPAWGINTEEAAREFHTCHPASRGGVFKDWTDSCKILQLQCRVFAGEAV